MNGRWWVGGTLTPCLPGAVYPVAAGDQGRRHTPRLGRAADVRKADLPAVHCTGRLPVLHTPAIADCASAEVLLQESSSRVHAVQQASHIAHTWYSCTLKNRTACSCAAVRARPPSRRPTPRSSAPSILRGLPSNVFGRVGDHSTMTPHRAKGTGGTKCDPVYHRTVCQIAGVLAI